MDFQKLFAEIATYFASKFGGYYSVDWTAGLTYSYFWFLHMLWLLLLCFCQPNASMGPSTHY